MSSPAFDCPLCEGLQCQTERVLTDLMSGDSLESYTQVRCTTCGLLRLHPLPSDEQLQHAYGSGYSPHTRSGLSGRGKSLLEGWSVRRLRQYVGPPNRVLDVGCARGDLLDAIRRAGNSEVAGVETSAAAARVAQSRGLRVHEGSIEDASFEGSSFDTVLLSHTLEHVRDPLRTMREVARILTPGGAAILWLPNVESWEARLLGRRWIGFDAPRHLTTFGVSTLTRLLAEAGFSVRSVRHEAVGLEWVWALRYVVRDRWPKLERPLRLLHAPLILLATPLAAIGAVTRRSGRIRVIAIKGPARP